MKMIAQRLTKNVRIEGKPLFGRYKAWVELNPALLHHPFEWSCKTGGGTLRIDPGCVFRSRMQNLAIRTPLGDSCAHVLEHLLPLRAAGLLGAEIAASHCLPYDGSGRQFFQKVLPYCEEGELKVPCHTVSSPCRWSYPKPRGNQVAYTEILPRDDGKLVVDITIAYLGLGGTRKVFVFPDNALVETLSKTRSQGYPAWRWHVSKVLGTIGWWKHHQAIQWMHEHSQIQTLDLFARHRAFDLLGALQMITKGWLSAQVISVCSGHEADVEVCRLAVRDGLKVVD